MMRFYPIGLCLFADSSTHYYNDKLPAFIKFDKSVLSLRKYILIFYLLVDIFLFIECKDKIITLSICSINILLCYFFLILLMNLAAKNTYLNYDIELDRFKPIWLFFLNNNKNHQYGNNTISFSKRNSWNIFYFIFNLIFTFLLVFATNGSQVVIIINTSVLIYFIANFLYGKYNIQIS